ncbi:hypothetical protein CPB86DRAFT_666022, partial [Serendipita vermifera]
LTRKQADVLQELNELSANLEETLSLLKTIQELEKRHPVSLRAIEGQVAPLLDHFKTSLFMYLRSRADEVSLSELTIMQ